MADALERMTVVIPTYGRPDFVRRQVGFWAGSPVKLVIADGSPHELRVEGIDFPSNVTYIPTDGDFHSRMLRLSEEVSTEFVAVLGDDDFFSPDGLSSCVTRLDEEPGLVGCVGRSIRFFFQDGRVLAEQRDPDSSEFPESVKSGLERLRSTYHPGKIGALFYGVYRTQPWKDVVRSAYSVRFKTGYIYDTIIRTLLTYRGPIGIQDVLTWYCSSENPPIRSAPGMDRSVGFVDWLTSSETAPEVAHCRSLMVDDLERLGIDSRDEIERAVNFVLDELRHRYEKKALIRQRWTSRIKARLIASSPSAVKRLGKRLMPNALRKSLDWTVIEFESLIEILIHSGITVSTQDSQKIMRAVRETHRLVN